MKNDRSICTLLIMISLILGYVFLPLTQVVADEGDDVETPEDDFNESIESDSNDILDINDDNIREEQAEYEKRDMQIQINATNVAVESDWGRGDLEDVFKFFFTLDRTPQIIIDYATQQNTSEIDLKYIIIFEKIKEYIDTNNNGRYNRNDTILSEYKFENVTFKNITYTVEKTANNETLHRISTGTVDGVFGIVLYMVGNLTRINSGFLAPTEVKIDFIINYPYITNDSLIALKTKINSQYETETETEFSDPLHINNDFESNIKIISKNYTGFFSWGNQASVDNINRRVNITIIQVEGSRSDYKNTIYFCYPHGTHIVHDPKVGIIGLSSLSFIPSQSTLISLNSLFTYLAVWVVIALIFIGTIYLRKRM